MSPSRRNLWPVVGLLVLGTCLGMIYLLATPGPVLASLEPAVGLPGTLTRLYGRNFGLPHLGALTVGGEPVKPSDIVRWSEDTIEFHIPDRAPSGPIRLQTPTGATQGLFWVNQGELPVVLGARERAGGAVARIEGIEPPVAQVSETILIRGSGFGASKGEVSFSWGPLPAGGISLEPYLRVSGQEIEEWTDATIRVRVPTGAASGTLRVRTPAGVSNGYFFEVGTQTGFQEFRNPRQYLLSRSLDTTWDRGASVDRRVPVLGLAEDWRQRAFAINRAPTSEFGPSTFEGGTLWWQVPHRLNGRVAAEWEVTFVVFEVRLQLRGLDTPELVPFPAVAPYLVSDEAIPWNNEFVRNLSMNIGGWPAPGRGPLERARGLFNWLAGNFRWNESAPNLLEAVRLGRGSVSQGCQALVALLRASRIPARVVRGYLILPNPQLLPHFWVEFYLPGIGWIGADPYLGSGNVPEGFPAVADPLSTYFGQLDAKRLALEREGEPVSVPAEEGEWFRLEQDRILWHSLEITGVY